MTTGPRFDLRFMPSRTRFVGKVNPIRFDPICWCNTALHYRNGCIVNKTTLN